ncbi:hypothetical protein N7495_002658 [Penicillium taxi]|uniref:uncharacterized protein n=1 Tax=Penicillium taxi TaxID=168475 RepID=UPI00254524CC|nr:uncharacterized protein N7495_002658 [Penicillium taxi]KAJ5902130.1 hypothetical protein N7495_002658 [Penicillium taxi]
MDMNHLIGQRFILISKSDVRYVGTLHEINPEASTIALENVMSYGTEGRRGNPALEIAGSSSIYEYIVFRGSDVKDISVEGKKEPAQPEPHRIPDDPAILGDPRSNNRVVPKTPRVILSNLRSRVACTLVTDSALDPLRRSPPGPGFPPYGAPNGAPPGWFPGQGYPQGPGFPPHIPGYPGPPHQQRPGPPAVGPNPTSELPGDKVATKSTPPVAQNAPTPPVESKPSVAEALGPAAAHGGSFKPSTPLVGPKPVAPTGPVGANQAFTDATSAATRAVAEAMAKLPPQRQHDASVDGVTRKMNEMRPYNDNRAPRGGHQHPRGGRGGARPPKSIEVPTSDYDFQTANAKFNKQDLVKEAIASGAPAVEAEAHTLHGDPDEEEDSSAALYNRSSSFFDNISSEARDREENRPGGREWRGVEEKRNIETFGQGSVDGYRGNYRGRGRGRGYGRGRGGYNNRGGYGGRGRGNRATSQV